LTKNIRDVSIVTVMDMGYEFHTRRVSSEFSDLKDLAALFLSENNSGSIPKPPDPKVLREQAAYVGVPDTIANGLCFAAERVASDAALTALYAGLTDLTKLERYGTQTGGIMQALALFGALPFAIEKHRALGVPDNVTRDTFGDLLVAFEHYAGRNGGALGAVYYNEWLHHHYKAELFKIGRLQYILKEYKGYARLFVDDATGEAILTSQPGVSFRGDGHVDGQNGVFSPETRWKSESHEDSDFIRTNCLFVNGRAIRTPVALDKKIWRVALESGRFGLEMHIPRGERLTRADCVESLREAWRFHKKFFPERAFEAFYCGSWLLDSCVQNFLPPDSGIVTFQKLYRLYPIDGDEWSFFDRGFGAADPETELKDVMKFARGADRSTSLRRGVADYILAGGRLHSGAGVIHQYDLIKF